MLSYKLAPIHPSPACACFFFFITESGEAHTSAIQEVLQHSASLVWHQLSDYKSCGMRRLLFAVNQNCSLSLPGSHAIKGVNKFVGNNQQWGGRDPEGVKGLRAQRFDGISSCFWHVWVASPSKDAAPQLGKLWTCVLNHGKANIWRPRPATMTRTQFSTDTSSNEAQVTTRRTATLETVRFWFNEGRLFWLTIHRHSAPQAANVPSAIALITSEWMYFSTECRAEQQKRLSYLKLIGVDDDRQMVR